jgi:dienelactone hydrolase
MSKIIIFLSILTSLFGFLITSISCSKTSPDIQIQPNPSLVDEKVGIKISGLKPNQSVTLKATMEENQPSSWELGNQKGRVWQSHAEFTANENGTVDLSKEAPSQGTYKGIDAMGLFWSMEIIGDSEHAQDAGLLDPVEIQFDLEINGKIAASTRIIRRFITPNVHSVDVYENGLVAKLFEPETGAPHPGILVLGGSEGGINSAELRAALLASHGYAALAVAYYRMDDLPKMLAQIPLEYFKNAIDWMESRETVDNHKLGVMGWSKGGELALLLASRFSELRAVVAYVPSHVVWQGIGYGSSWTYKGEPLPYVPYKPGAGGYDPQNPTNPINLGELYLGSLDNQEAVAQASIPVEDINGPVLLISGHDDQMWPSQLMAEKIISRLKEHNFTYQYDHLPYEQAGHGITSYYWPTSRPEIPGFYSLGGTAEGDAQAQADSWPKVLQFFNNHLNSSP